MTADVGVIDQTVANAAAAAELGDHHDRHHLHG